MDMDYKSRFLSLQSRYFELVKRYLDLKSTNSTLEVKNEILESFLKQNFGDDFDNFVHEHEDQLNLKNFDSKNELANLFQEITDAQRASYFNCEEQIEVIDLEIKVEDDRDDGKVPVQNIPEFEVSKECGICSEIFDCTEHLMAHMDVHKRYPHYFKSKNYQNRKRKSKSQLALPIETKKSSAFGYVKLPRVNESKFNFSSNEDLFSKSGQMETAKILEKIYPWYTSDHNHNVEILKSPVVLL